MGSSINYDELQELEKSLCKSNRKLSIYSFISPIFLIIFFYIIYLFLN